MNLKSVKDDIGVSMITHLLQMAIPGTNLDHLEDDASFDAKVSNGKKITIPVLMKTVNDLKTMVSDSRLDDMSTLSDITGVAPSILGESVSSTSPVKFGNIVRILLGLGAYTFNFRKLSSFLVSVAAAALSTDKEDRIGKIVQSFLSLFAEDIDPEVSSAIINILPTIKQLAN